MPLYFRQFVHDRQDPVLESLTDAQFRVYWRLYCYAADQPARGIIDALPPGRLAIYVARGNETLLTKTLPVLVDRGLITALPGAGEGSPRLVITNWAERQETFPSETATGWRTRKARRRQELRDERDQDPPIAGAPVPINRDVSRESPEHVPTVSRQSPDSVPNSRDGVPSMSRIVGTTPPLAPVVPSYRDIPTGLYSPVPTNRDSPAGRNGHVPINRDNVTNNRDSLGIPYITRADDAPPHVRAEYTTHPVDGDEPEDPEASDPLPVSPSPQQAKRARAFDHPTATGDDTLYTGPPVTETGLTWWTHYLDVEGVNAPPAWTTIAWLQAQQEAMACKAQLDQRRIRNWALEMQRWLRNELQIRVRDGTVHKAEAAPGLARPANIPPPATGAGLIPPALSDSPDAAAARAKLADEQLRAWVLNLGRQLHDPAGVAAAQAALLAHLAAHPTLHVLSLKAQLVGLVEATAPQTLAELWGFARIPLAPQPPGEPQKERQPDDQPALAAAPPRP